MSIKGLNKSIQVADLFSALSENYAQFSVIQQEVGQRMLARLEYINFKPSVIIDAACATGINSRKIAQIFPKATVHGLDISAGMLAQARKKRKWFSKQKFSQINFSQTAFEDNSVDFIFSNLALPWVSDMQLCLKEWQRILKPEGLLLFSTFGPDTLIELKQAIYRTAKDVITHLIYV